MSNNQSWGRSQDHGMGNDPMVRTRGGPGESVRLFITLKQQDQDRRKLTVMAPLNVKISMLKRMIESEFADLFPHEPTFICAKLEDEFGYSLSNSSFVSELLKDSDRLFAVPESFNKDMSIVIVLFQVGRMHVTHDLSELTFVLKSIQQTIVAKLAEADLGSPETQMEILQMIVPVGFSLQQKAINHNVALTMKRILENERFDFVSDQSFALVVNLLVKLMTFWVNDLIFQDSFLLNLTVDILELLLKSQRFATLFKNATSINSLMSVSKLDFVSAQTRSRLIKIISYLSRPQFTDSYQPRPYDGPINQDSNMQSRGQRLRPPRSSGGHNDEQPNYQPSAMERRPNSIRRNVNDSRYQDQPDYQPQSYNQPDQIRRQTDGYPPRQNDYPQSHPNYPQSQPNQYDRSAANQAPNPIVVREKNPYSNPTNTYQRPNQTPLHNQPSNYVPNSNANPIAGQQQVFDGLVQDYLNLLTTESSDDMLIFAVQNLAEGIEQTIHPIMDSKAAYMQCLNLLEINMSQEWRSHQINILDAVAKNMNEARAKEGLKLKVVPRIMKALTYQPKEFHRVLFELLQASLVQSDFLVDVSTVIALVECPYARVSQFGIKVLALISETNRLATNQMATQFENYCKQIMDWALDSSRGDEFQYNALVVLSNLALNDVVRPQLLYLKGIEFFLRILRESHKVEAQRVAAKALLNLSIKSRDTKLAIVSQLGDEIQMMQRGGLDAIVQGYLQTLISTRDKRAMI